jgi:hypothetical protein
MLSLKRTNIIFWGFVLLLGAIFIPLLHAADLNQDGLDPDSQAQKDVGKIETDPIPELSIGMIETGDYQFPKNRLTALGYPDITLISPDSGLATFQQYDIVYLPVLWAQVGDGDFGTIESHAADYQAYVQSGGGLFIDQPNPYNQPGDRVTPTLLPYPITFYNWYNTGDWPPIIVDPNHEITQGLPADEMPGPADRMQNVDANYDVLVVGAATGDASLVVTEYGSGRILAQTAHPSASSMNPFSDEVYIRMVNWVGSIGVGPTIDIEADPNPAVIGQQLDVLMDLDNDPGQAFDAFVGLYGIINSSVIPLNSIVSSIPGNWSITDHLLFSANPLPSLPDFGLLCVLFNNTTGGNLEDWDFEFVPTTNASAAGDALALKELAEEYVKNAKVTDFEDANSDILGEVKAAPPLVGQKSKSMKNLSTIWGDIKSTK